MKTIKRISDAVDLSLKEKSTREIPAKFSIEVGNEPWKCYAVAISHRDVLCYCDKGTATFLVDSFGDLNTYTLFDWEKDSEKR